MRIAPVTAAIARYGSKSTETVVTALGVLASPEGSLRELIV
jgi:hypothetical protein